MDRRLRRLREELVDEAVPLPLDSHSGAALLRELTYARRAPHHEGRIARYGALVFSGVPDWDQAPQAPALISGTHVDDEVLRHFADGRSSFAVATSEGITGLASFEHSAEDEVTALRLQRTGAIVVQRSERATVRVCTARGVVIWNGSRWRFKPRAEDYVRALSKLAEHAEPAVLTGLLELSVHSLAAARVGATFVWNLDGRPTDDQRDGLLEFARSVTGPDLSVARRAHFPSLLSIEAQTDLATMVAADGSVGPIGVRLDHSTRAGQVVPPVGGSRHTSARRFTFDVPGVLAVVVSESGRVTAFSGGAVAAEIGLGQPATGARTSAEAAAEGPETIVHCSRCRQPVLVARPADDGSRTSQPQPCPVCESPLPVCWRVAILGVPVCPAP